MVGIFFFLTENPGTLYCPSLSVSFVSLEHHASSAMLVKTT